MTFQKTIFAFHFRNCADGGTQNRNCGLSEGTQIHLIEGGNSVYLRFVLKQLRL